MEFTVNGSNNYLQWLGIARNILIIKSFFEGGHEMVSFFDCNLLHLFCNQSYLGWLKSFIALISIQVDGIDARFFIFRRILCKVCAHSSLSVS